METDILTRLAACERSNRRLTAMVVLLSLTAIGAVVASCMSAVHASPSVLRVSELLVVDERGVVRVRIGGDLPDATIRGRRVGRGDRAAGVLLYDTTGQERGGYVTLNRTGYIGITLDSRDGQTAVFRADSAGSTTLRLWRGGDAVELKTDPDGARVNVLASGEVLTQIPAVRNPENTVVCTDLRSLRSQHPASAIRKACRERLTEDACNLCLGQALQQE